VLLAAAPSGAAGRGLLAGVGDVSASTALLWVRAPHTGEVGVEYAAKDDTITIRDAVRVDPSVDLTGRLMLTGLRPGTRYLYRVSQAAQSAAGEFVTAPGPDDPARVMLLWSGDLGGGGFCRRAGVGYRIFRAMARHRADFFVFAGDTIYSDHRCPGPGLVPGADFVATTLDEFRQKHRYNREDPALITLLEATSVYAIWDDHEVRNDFAGPTEPLMPIGRQAFLEYWPIAPPAEEPTRLYRRFRWGRLLEVFILDTRQYRSANSQPDGPAKTMLGPAQRQWLIDGVASSTATWKIVVTSVSLSVSTGRQHRDSWSSASLWGVPQDGAGFATERDAILGALRQRGVRNLVFLTADVHHSELIRHRPAPAFPFHEFIAGPLSATQGRPRALDAALNPTSLFARGGVNSYGEITIVPAQLTVRLLDEDGFLLATHAIKPE
jgi:alkaline phosphatase D